MGYAPPFLTPAPPWSFSYCPLSDKSIHLYTFCTHEMQNYCVKLVFCIQLLLKNCPNKTINRFKCFTCVCCCYVLEAPRTVKIVCCSARRAVLRWPAWQEADLVFSSDCAEMLPSALKEPNLLVNLQGQPTALSICCEVMMGQVFMPFLTLFDPWTEW